MIKPLSIDLSVNVGMIPSALPSSEGELWTNRFVT